MSENPTVPDEGSRPGDGPRLESGAYEVIRGRLRQGGDDLRGRLEKLNAARKQVFGAIDTRLVSTVRVVTANNCVPCDMAVVGDKVIFGYNVQLGLRSETELGDVFAVYRYEKGELNDVGLGLIDDPRFREDFKNLYRYYKKARLARLALLENRLYMVFRVGETVDAIKTFKWVVENGALTYADNRSDHELKPPPQHEFEWARTTRDQHRPGAHPHISIEDKVFVETTEGDLTIKVEDNTATGAGIYSEPVENRDQTLDDAEICYAILGNLVLLKVRPYQEKDYRHIVYSTKAEVARRLDAIADACVLLPEDHGIIFPSGIFLQTGDFKEFDDGLSGMRFLRRMASPNGEDTMYVFCEPQSGTYVLLKYNLIEQSVETPLLCNGFSLFESGEMVCFRASSEPTKHHAIQIWQTPFVGPNFVAAPTGDSFLFKLGNRDIVRAMAGCRHVLSLIAKDESYGNVYVDIAREAGSLLDTYFWLDREEAFAPKAALSAIRDAASAAIEEFEKVTRVRKDTAAKVVAANEKSAVLLRAIRTARYDAIEGFVADLTALRGARGEVIALRDLRYVDFAAVDALEKELASATESLAGRCVDFLLGDDALVPYVRRVASIEAEVPAVAKAADAKAVEERATSCGVELELLVETVSSLKIDDATKRTAIISRISEIFASLNRVRSAIKSRLDALSESEGRAEFASQMGLLDQAVVGYLDVCDTPERCEEYLQKVAVQLTELEGKFASFEGFLVELASKRTDLTGAFESRKLALTEARSKRADGLLRSAERVLEGVRSRAGKLGSVEELGGYFASDLLVSKVRDIVSDLRSLGDNVKADDVETRLKTVQQESLRQLKDRQELFAEGDNAIRLGDHLFSVSTEEVALGVLPRDGKLFLHLAGTKLFEPIPESAVAETRPVWEQELVSESRDVYRAEYLAYELFHTTDAGLAAQLSAAAAEGTERLSRLVRELMSPRYAEGYVKGVHDTDTAKILGALLEIRSAIGLLRYSAAARAAALLSWSLAEGSDGRRRLEERGRALRALRRMVGELPDRALHVDEVEAFTRDFVVRTGLFADASRQAAEYLLDVLLEEGRFAITRRAEELSAGLLGQLERRGILDELRAPLASAKDEPRLAFRLARSFVEGYVASVKETASGAALDEASALLVAGLAGRRQGIGAETERILEGMAGNHPRIEQGRLRLSYHEFEERLGRYKANTVPLFERHQDVKRRVVAEASARLKLEEMRPKVMSSFVRNELIDKVYLPLIGANLAKQIGVVGQKTRTDRTGLLLLVSPPGYGKTTLMEYVANRLGLVFMKVNGPAIGSRVTSFDPQEAPNAAARAEVERINLAFEMGDNTMLYLDDIQHLSPELLQKFISLCDAQRKVEGVYGGRTRTYDLRGRKFCVVMAGNPYSESGEAFKIPDMLANRADTYNLGDIIGGSLDAFRLSYLENAATSNDRLSRLATKSYKDFRAVVQAVETGTTDSLDLEASHAPDELAESISVIRKLLRVRDVVLTVNKEYIRSAAQADDYRTEPPFKLQGSYRNMNRMAEKVLPIMNDDELEQLVMDHYRSEAQTLTTGAEANLLKLHELLDKQDEAQRARFEEIKSTFNRNQLLRSAGSDDRLGQILAQLATFKDGLSAIQRALEGGVAKLVAEKRSAQVAVAAPPPGQSVALSDELLSRLTAFSEGLSGIQRTLADGVGKLASAPRSAPVQVGAPVQVSTPAAAASVAVPRELLAQLAAFGERLSDIHRTLADGVAMLERIPRAAPVPVAPAPGVSTTRTEELLASIDREIAAARSTSEREALERKCSIVQREIIRIDPVRKPGGETR